MAADSSNTITDAELASPQKNGKKEKVLCLEDTQQQSMVMANLNMLRKNRKFCDVVLQVGCQELHAHRAVLASSSRYLSNLFSTDLAQEYEGNRYVIEHMDSNAFEKLVNYAYTSRLEVSAEEAKTVYKTATKLKMHRAAEACSQFLADNLKAMNCLGIRSSANRNDDLELMLAADNYIQSHLEEIIEVSQELVKLPHVQIDILQFDDEQEINIKQHMCSKLVNWLQALMEYKDIDLAGISEKVHLLRLNSDGSFRDCKDIDDSEVRDTEIVQDYKKLSKKHSDIHERTKRSSPTRADSAPTLPIVTNGNGAMTNGHSENGRSTPNGHIRYIRQSSDLDDARLEPQWKVIGITKTAESTHVALAYLKDTLCRLTVHIRMTTPAPRAPHSPVSSRPASIINGETNDLLPTMSTARCSMGTANLNGKLFVCGGYDRGECLRTVEMYDPSINEWQELPSMHSNRGRFDSATIDGKVFAVGGSDGTQELSTAEFYDEKLEKWMKLPNMPTRRSSNGVAVVNGKVYVIGGWSGQAGIRTCHTYNYSTNKWEYMPPLQTGRSQAAVACLNGKVYAVGGCDTWNCLSSVEVFDPEVNEWGIRSPMGSNRRGAAAMELNGKLYVIGGSDGSHTLASVEIYDPETDTWTPGPNMDTPRANMGVAVIDGKLHAVGGFSGKIFLNTMEVLDPKTNVWTSCI